MCNTKLIQLEREIEKALEEIPDTTELLRRERSTLAYVRRRIKEMMEGE